MWIIICRNQFGQELPVTSTAYTGKLNFKVGGPRPKRFKTEAEARDAIKWFNPSCPGTTFRIEPEKAKVV